MNQQAQVVECFGVPDLNAFIKGQRQLYPQPNGEHVYFQFQQPHQYQVHNPQIAEPPLPSPNLPLPLPPPPPDPCIRDNMGHLACCFFPIVYFILSFLRIVWVIIALVIPGGVLWIISDVMYIVALAFICCNIRIIYYRAMVIIFAVSMVIDIVGLIYSTVYLGVYVKSIPGVNELNICKEPTSYSDVSTTGYYYGLTYESDTYVIQNCVDTSSSINIGLIWVIILLVASAFMYCSFSCLLYYTHRSVHQVVVHPVEVNQVAAYPVGVHPIVVS